MSLVLAMNKESMLIDPINWDLFKSRIIKLSGDWSPGLLLIPPHTDALFKERSPLLHPSRSVSKHLLMFYYNQHRLSTFSTRMLLKIPVDPSLFLLGLPISFAR